MHVLLEVSYPKTYQNTLDTIYSETVWVWTSGIKSWKYIVI